MEADSIVLLITRICIKHLCRFFDIDFIIITHMSFNSFVLLSKNFIEGNSIFNQNCCWNSVKFFSCRFNPLFYPFDY